MRLIIAIPSLDRGGAQRVVTTLANHWAARGWEVSILTLAAPAQVPAYALDPRVGILNLDATADSHSPLDALLANLTRVRRIRAAIRDVDPDAVVSFMLSMNVLVLLACVDLRLRVVVSERAHPPAAGGPRAWRFLARVLYHRAAAVVVQTRAALGFFSAGIAARCRVIPNPLDGGRFMAHGPADRSRPVIAAMGRLDTEKGFDLLIRAFAAAAADMPGWRLEIWGTGPEHGALSSLIASLGLASRASLMGATTAPEAVYRAAGAFVLSSRSEGYPNVLCEAMACGVPVIAFDCPSGPADIVEHERTGLLVAAGDTEALAAAMRRVAQSPALREALGARAEAIRARLTPERIAAAWAELLAGPSPAAAPIEPQGAWK